MQHMVKPSRLVLLAVIFALLLGIYFVALYKLQIIGGREYYSVGETETKEETTIAAARGNILDRYGRVLVSNSLCNNLSINVTELFSQDDPNAIILELCKAVNEFGDTYTDTLPITMEPPFEFTEMDTLQTSMLEAWLEANDMDKDSSAVEVLAAMRTRYEVGSEYSAEDARIIVGVRYEINDRYNINTTPYVFAEDISMPLLTYLMEQDIPGFEVSSSYVREYKTEYAAHLLGYTGKLTAEEWDTYADKDYSLDAYVGKDGVEYAFEEYLHGTDGEAEIYSNLDGVTLRTKYTKEPQPGNHVYLTLDIGLQEVCEEALASHIESINEERAQIIADAEKYGTESTEMISGGAIVVVKVDTGEPLALASWPTYDAATMLEDYEELLADENAPLYNRALMGVYAPGSTFKPCTATALLAEGILTPLTTLKTEGQFTKYIDDGYAPECWIYSSYDYTHGEINVVQAITYSCNYFFYYYGDILGIDKMAYYAKLYGLGESTGIELPEVTGQMSTQSFKEQYTGISWFQGDTLQSAIGQSYTEFTPLQMAEYCAAIANKGTRHSASILKEVRSYDYSKTLFSRETEVLSELDIDESIFDSIQYGMWGVIYDSASTLTDQWLDSDIVVAAKTGTAQRGEGLVNNAMFILFAPYDDEPEIAIAIAVEKGGAGATLSPVARKIVDYYFTFQANANTVEEAYTLLK
jgi:penicillin-binding protein 2